MGSARFFVAMRSAQTNEAMRSAQTGRDAIILKFAAPQNVKDERGARRTDRPSIEAKIEFDDKVP
jgi:hypothetical protein